MKLFFVFSLCLLGVLSTPKLRYDNFKVHRVIPQTDEQLIALQNLEQSGRGLSFWTEASRVMAPVDIMVSPNEERIFKDFMLIHRLDVEVLIDNVQDKIDHEKPTSRSDKYGWLDYYNLEDVN